MAIFSYRKTMRFLTLLSTLLALVLPGCVSTPPAAPAAKPYDACICGPTISAEGKPYCAIWGDNKNPAQANAVWVSEARENCEPSDCSQLFSRFCQKIQMSGVPRPSPQEPAESCYCDAILLENDQGQVQLNCAAWAENGKNLIEYYPLDDCSPQRCGQEPFALAPKACGNSFKSFYAPLMNHR